MHIYENWNEFIFYNLHIKNTYTRKASANIRVYVYFIAWFINKIDSSCKLTSSTVLEISNDLLDLNGEFTELKYKINMEITKHQFILRVNKYFYNISYPPGNFGKQASNRGYKISIVCEMASIARNFKKHCIASCTLCINGSEMGTSVRNPLGVAEEFLLNSVQKPL